MTITAPTTSATQSLNGHQVTTLEAYADTVIPGAKRHPDDIAIAGVSDGVGAVAAGAISVLSHPAAGIGDGIGEMANLLNAYAANGRERDVPPELAFASLTYEERREVISNLTSADEPMHDLWFLLALFSYMAYDSSPHRPTAEAATSPSGLQEMGFAPPNADGRWAFNPAGYGRPMAELHPLTDSRGNLP